MYIFKTKFIANINNLSHSTVFKVLKNKKTLAFSQDQLL